MRDIKYHYSEGYGAANPGLYATPWLDVAMKLLRKSLPNGLLEERLPLWIGFTHREEILYLAVLLGIAWQGPEDPQTDRIDENRKWRVSSGTLSWSCWSGVFQDSRRSLTRAYYRQW